MNKYKIRIQGIGTKPAIIEVEGEPVHYPKIDYIKLFVHQMPEITFSLNGEVHIWHNHNRDWHVSEEETGLMITYGKTKSGAIRHAYKVIQNYSKDKLLEFIKNNLVRLQDEKNNKRR